MDYIVYFDETGDDGNNVKTSETFLLTGVYMPIISWTDNYNILKILREELKNDYGFHTRQEMHTQPFLTCKFPYRSYKWSIKDRQEIIKKFALAISNMNISVINVMIDKRKIKAKNYNILKTALTYSVQRIENDSKGKWKYIIITDKGRIIPMKRTAREIRSFNLIQSKFSSTKSNKPIENLIEDILEKDSKESYFVQITDFISYFVHLYNKCIEENKNLPKRVGNCISKSFVNQVMLLLKNTGKFNLKANPANNYGIVIYPKK